MTDRERHDPPAAAAPAIDRHHGHRERRRGEADVAM
jgi:hypothetical protein